MKARVPHLFAAGLVGQGFRFALAGITTAIVYLSTTTVLAVVVGLPFQVALIIGYGVALAVHFTLQRLFVWAHEEKEHALTLPRQLGWYLLVAATQYGVIAANTSLLPPVLGLSPEAVFLMTAPVMTSINFLLYRNSIFKPRPTARPAAIDAATLCTLEKE